MAKYEIRLKAREMRKMGESVKVIAKSLGVSKSTVSLWVRDIILSVSQMEALRKRLVTGSERGRMKGAFMQKQRRLDKMKEMEKLGVERFAKLSDQEFFAAGISLYWAEGSKKTRKLQICNSDPKMIRFMMDWFRKYFDLDIGRFSARVAINEIHKKREMIVRNYWSGITGIPISQFRKTSYKKVKPHKVYANYDNYFGTLDLAVLKPGELYYKMLGLIGGLANVAQW